MHHVDVVEFTSAMSPAGYLINGAVAIEMMKSLEMMKSCVGIGLQRTAKAVQMLSRMLALTIFGISKPHRRRGRIAGRPVVPHIGPQSGRFGLAVAGSEHWNRGVIGVNLRSCQHMASDLID
jgi:hypothetical protein